MSDSLFLPRELFQPEAPRAAHATPAAPARPNRSLSFKSGADVAADLLQAMGGTPAFVERRRKPRSGNALKIAR